METNSNELDDNLLEEVQTSPDKNRDNYFVHSILPRSGTFISIQMMILHSRKEGYFDCQPPEEESCRNFECFTKISPFLVAIRKETRYQTHGIRDTFGNELRKLALFIQQKNNLLVQPIMSTKQFPAIFQTTEALLHRLTRSRT